MKIIMVTNRCHRSEAPIYQQKKGVTAQIPVVVTRAVTRKPAIYLNKTEKTRGVTSVTGKKTYLYKEKVVFFDIHVKMKKSKKRTFSRVRLFLSGDTGDTLKYRRLYRYIGSKGVTRSVTRSVFLSGDTSGDTVKRGY